MKNTNTPKTSSAHLSWPKFQWQDPFLLEQEFTEEELQVKDTARRFANRYLKSRIQNDFKNEAADREIFREFGKLGFLGSTIHGYDCAGISPVSYGLIAHEIEAIDSAYRSLVSVQSSLVMTPIHDFGSDEQKNYYLPSLASGKFIGCFGLTEPNHGSDPSGITSRAVKTKNGFTLDGEKMWITNAPIADVFIVWARLNDSKEIRGFILERSDAGLSTPTIKNKLSLRASTTGHIVMQNVEIPENRMLPFSAGLKSAMHCLNHARYGIAWGALGAAKHCWLEVRDYVCQREQFGKALASTQLIQKKLADMQTEISMGLQACFQAGRLKERNALAPETISLIKRNSCGKALAIAREARDMLGANGITDAYSCMRHAINLETVNTYEGTHDIHALILGRAITGYSAF